MKNKLILFVLLSTHWMHTSFAHEVNTSKFFSAYFETLEATFNASKNKSQWSTFEHQLKHETLPKLLEEQKKTHLDSHPYSESFWRHYSPVRVLGDKLLPFFTHTAERYENPTPVLLGFLVYAPISELLEHSVLPSWLAICLYLQWMYFVFIDFFDELGSLAFDSQIKLAQKPEQLWNHSLDSTKLFAEQVHSLIDLQNETPGNSLGGLSILDKHQDKNFNFTMRVRHHLLWLNIQNELLTEWSTSLRNQAIMTPSEQRNFEARTGKIGAQIRNYRKIVLKTITKSTLDPYLVQKQSVLWQNELNSILQNIITLAHFLKTFH